MSKSTEYLLNLKTDAVSPAEINEFIVKMLDLKLQIEAIVELLQSNDIYLKDIDNFGKFAASMQAMTATLEYFMDETFDVLFW